MELQLKDVALGKQRVFLLLLSSSNSRAKAPAAALHPPFLHLLPLVCAWLYTEAALQCAGLVQAISKATGGKKDIPSSQVRV